MAEKWDVYQVICNLAIWSNGTRFAGWQKSIASGVATTWTANDLDHSHQIPILLTLPPHSKSDRTNNNLLATLFWPIRAPVHNTMTKWLLPLPPNTHITCTAAAIADPLNILLLWNCKIGEELWILWHRKLSISLLFWICALIKGTTCNKTMSTILFWEHQLECHC